MHRSYVQRNSVKVRGGTFSVWSTRTSLSQVINRGNRYALENRTGRAASLNSASPCTDRKNPSTYLTVCETSEQLSDVRGKFRLSTFDRKIGG